MPRRARARQREGLHRSDAAGAHRIASQAVELLGVRHQVIHRGPSLLYALGPRRRSGVLLQSLGPAGVLVAVHGRDTAPQTALVTVCGLCDRLRL